MKHLLTTCVIFILSSCSHFSGEKTAFIPTPVGAEECVRRHGAIDLGSGTMRLSIVKVDRCQKKILEQLAYEEIKVDFKKEMRANNNQLTREQQGILKQNVFMFAKKLNEHQAQQTRGVATALYRQATNAAPFFEALEKESGISLKVITQEQEAELGLQAVAYASNKNPANLVVWDIGGESMQIVTGAGEYFLSDLASNSFREQVLLDIVKKTDGEKSPNPIGKERIKAAWQLASRQTTKSIPPHIKEKMQQAAKKGNLIGIGGLHNHSIRQVTTESLCPKHNRITRRSIELAMRNMAIYDDQKLAEVLIYHCDGSKTKRGPNYVHSDVTNLALVYGLMKSVDVSVYRVLDLNLTQALIF